MSAIPQGHNGRKGKCLSEFQMSWCHLETDDMLSYDVKHQNKDIYQMSSSMLHLSNGYELTLSLYNRVQNDCQIYWNFFSQSFFCLFSFKLLPILEFLPLRFTPPCLYSCLGGFLVSAHRSGNGSPSEESLPAILVCPQEHTATYSRAFPLNFFFNPLMQNKMCICENDADLSCLTHTFRIHNLVWVYDLHL